MKIGLLDSGMGGLNVLQEAMHALPREQFLYYADEKNVPYGEKTKKEVIGYVEEAVQFMVQQGVKAIVIACNTATSVAISHLRQEYDFPIIGMEPAVKLAIDTYGEKRVLATATPITVKGEKMRCLIECVDKQHLVDLVPLPKLVHFAEKEIFDTPEVEEYLRQQFSSYELEQYASVVLGCTHFIYFKDSYRKVLPEYIHLVDGNGGTIRHLIEELKKRNLLENQKQTVTYYYTGKEVTNQEEMARIQRYLKRSEEMMKIK